MYAFAPNGLPILGTFDRCSCRADITGDTFKVTSEGLDFEHVGHTKFFYEEQRTNYEDGERLFLDPNGAQWKESEVVFRERPDGPDLHPFDVVGYYPDSGQGYTDEVMATDEEDAARRTLARCYESQIGETFDDTFGALEEDADLLDLEDQVGLRIISIFAGFRQDLALSVDEYKCR